MRIKHLIPLSLFLLCIPFTSCDDAGVVPGGNVISVKGTIVSYGAPAEGYTVSANGINTQTDPDGKFILTGVEIPYNLIVAPPQSNGIFSYYSALSSDDLYINVTQNVSGGYHKKVSLFVDMDFLTQDQRLLSVFIPDNGQETVRSTPFSNQDTLGCIVQWNESSSVAGKLILMVYTLSNNKIISFDRYYEKTGLTITTDEILNDTITINTPFLDIPEETVSGTVYNPNGSSENTQTTMLIKFPNNIPLHIERFYNFPNFDFVVPVLNSLNVEYIVEASSIAGDPYSFRSLNVNPGSVNNFLQLYRAPDMIFPGVNDTAVLSSTNFKWSAEDSPLFRVALYPSFGSSTIMVYTNSLETTLPDLTAYGFNINTNNPSFMWNVTAYYGFDNMNTFLNENNQLNGTEGISGSNFRNLFLIRE